MTAPGTFNPYGTDLWLQILPDGSLDIDPTMREVGGLQVLAQSLVIRQLNNPGAILGYPDECINIRNWLNKGFTQAQIQQIGASVQAQILRDQRVNRQGTSVQVTFQQFAQPRGGVLTLLENIQASAGPFSLTLGISQVTIGVLFNGQPFLGTMP